MSYFRDNIDKLAGYTPGFQPDCGDVVKLNTNENPYLPSPNVTKTLQNFDLHKLQRYPSPIGQDFRKAAAKLNGLEPENILCTNGGDDALTICIRSFCDKDRPLAFPSPTYTLYEVLAKIQNCPVIEVAYPADLSLPTEELAATNAKLTIVCNPNAPTSSFISPEKIGELATKLKGKSILLIDEAYADFAEDNCVRLISEHENVIILRSMSKGYSLAGLRFGYLMSNPEMIDGLMKVKDSYNVDSIAIAVAAAAVSDQEYFKSNVEKIKAERASLSNQLRELGFIVPQSNTNFVFAQSVKQSAKSVFDKLVEKNIFVRYFPRPGIDDKLRITVGTQEENSKLIEALKEIVS